MEFYLYVEFSAAKVKARKNRYCEPSEFAEQV